MGDRSIGERIKRARSPAAQRQTAQDWAANWRRDHNETLARIEQALQRGNIDEAGQYLGQLKSLNAKAMGALPRVIDRLTEDSDD